MSQESTQKPKRLKFSVPSQYQSRRTLILAGVGVVALVLVLWAHARWNHITENDAYVMANMVTISSRIDGWIAERPVTDGDAVTKGKILVVIDQREAKLQVAELVAKKASLEKQYEQVQAQLAETKESTENAVAAATARHQEATANVGTLAAQMEQAQIDYKRNKPLVASDVISRESWDQTRTANDAAQAKHKQAKAQVTEASANLADAITKRADVTVLQKQSEDLAHQIKMVEAQIGQKQVELDDRVVLSPIDGVVDQKFVEPGEYVIPGQRLVLLHDPKSVWVEVHLKETKLTDVRVGQPVDIEVDAYPGRTFTGRVERVGNVATNQFALLPNPNPSGNFTKIAQRVPVRIKVDQPADNPLRPGMMVEVDIDASKHGAAQQPSPTPRHDG